MDPETSSSVRRRDSPITLKNPAKLAEVFYKETGNKNDMTKEQFFRLTGCKSEIFGNHLFEVLDTGNRGLINIGEMMDGFAKLHSRNVEDRTRFVFSLFDLDGDGVITREELHDVLHSSVVESGAEMNIDELNTLVKALLQLFDSDRTDRVYLEDFSNVLRNYPDLLEGLTFGGFGRIHSIKKTKTVSKSWAPRWLRHATIWVLDNPQYIITYGLTMVAIVLAFLWLFSKFAGNCDGVDMDERDPLTGYTRNNLLEIVKFDGNKTMVISDEEKKYMVFSHHMAKLDPIICRCARKRKLLGWALPVAKGCAQAMKVVFTLILIPVSRNLMTTLRETFLKQYLAFDEAIEYHKFLGTLGFWLAWAHTLCHGVGISRWRDEERFKWWSFAFPDKRTRETTKGIERYANGSAVWSEAERLVSNGEFKDGLPRMVLNTKAQPDVYDLLISVIGITGVVLIVVYTVAVIFAFDYPKRLSCFQPTPQEERGHRVSICRRVVLRIGRSLNDFNNFWYSHQLFGIFYLALLIHPLPRVPSTHQEAGTNDTWMWVGIPLLVYIGERLLRVRRTGRNTRVLGMELLPGNVLGLKTLRPQGLRYTPGQYVFINCPQVARFEWHPFTLTSCPGDSYLGVHIRNAGDWTGALHKLAHDYIESKQESMHSEESSRRGSIQEGASRYLMVPVVGDEVEVVERFPFTIFVDGPFGAPAQNYADYKVVVLIGAGIGVTPFASVLTDLLDALKGSACPHCGKTNLKYMRLPLYKAYFYWTIRSRSEVSWFKHLLEAIAKRDTENLLEINIHITGIKGAQDLKTMMFCLAQYETATEGASDPDSRALTRFGRINWPTIFDKVIAEFPNESNVGVFYCGPNRLASHLAELCKENSTEATKFNFMRESFG
eukprot:g4425.t1